MCDGEAEANNSKQGAGEVSFPEWQKPFKNNANEDYSLRTIMHCIKMTLAKQVYTIGIFMRVYVISKISSTYFIVFCVIFDQSEVYYLKS